MKVALDVMGGDNGLGVIIEGAIQAAREYGIEVILVGREDLIKAELSKHTVEGLKLPIVNATEVIEMGEHPAQAVRRKKDSSVMVGLRLIEKGEANAFVSAGHSGATLAGAILGAPGRIKGVERPALATIFPAKEGAVLILDVGANTEVKPEYLVQFAQMGSIYFERLFKRANPRVGLLSNGEEENKGSMLVQEAHQLLKQTAGINFIGNVEGKDVPEGLADVVVTDGFTGNIFLKTAEGVAAAILGALKKELTSSLINKLLALGLKPAFNRVRKNIDSEEYGGAPLLGVNGIVIISHGRTKAKGIKNAIRVANEAAQNGTVEAIQALYK
ncbi:MAG: phosphate acyltransferase PlsX [Chloroflexota bacterium]